MKFRVVENTSDIEKYDVGDELELAFQTTVDYWVWNNDKTASWCFDKETLRAEFDHGYIQLELYKGKKSDSACDQKNNLFKQAQNKMKKFTKKALSLFNKKSQYINKGNYFVEVDHENRTGIPNLENSPAKEMFNEWLKEQFGEELYEVAEQDYNDEKEDKKAK